MQNYKVSFLTQAAMIAALYVVLTMTANALCLANYAVQIRFSEALTILPYFTPAAIPGLTAGCLLSNILTGCALPDIIFGSLATLIGAVFTWLLCNHPRRPAGSAICESRTAERPSILWKRNFHSKNKWLAPVPPIIANAVIVPLILRYTYGIEPLWLSFITVTIGEVISCGLLGLLLLLALKKRAGRD